MKIKYTFYLPIVLLVGMHNAYPLESQLKNKKTTYLVVGTSGVIALTTVGVVAYYFLKIRPNRVKHATTFEDSKDFPTPVKPQPQVAVKAKEGEWNLSDKNEYQNSLSQCIEIDPGSFHSSSSSLGDNRNNSDTDYLEYELSDRSTKKSKKRPSSKSNNGSLLVSNIDLTQPKNRKSTYGFHVPEEPIFASPSQLPNHKTTSNVQRILFTDDPDGDDIIIL